MSEGDLSPADARSAITWRSLSTGTVGVVVIGALTPYNDFIINNTLLTASFFPPVITLALVLLVVLNALIRLSWPRQALGAGELGIILAMLLASCTVPGIGLLRTVLPLPVSLFYLGQTDPQLWSVFSGLDLPAWLFAVPDMASGRSSEVVNAFYSRVPPGSPIPWGAWIIPLLGWGAFFACVAMALLTLTPILRHQWAVNERLAFPLAQIGTMLIEAPERGRRFNPLLGSRAFWVTTAAVFFLQSLVALHLYLPKFFPAFSFTYDLHGTLTEGYFRDLSGFVKRSTIYFTVIGITYFVPARVGFSLWSIVLIELFLALTITNLGGEVQNGVWDDQHLGSCIAVLFGIGWVGRRHWISVTRQALGASPSAGEPQLGGWARGLVLAIAGMLTWLTIVGVGPVIALAIVAVTLAVHVLVARVVTETGIPFVRVTATVPQIAMLLPTSVLTGREMFFASTSTFFGAVSTREGLLPHTLHGLQISQATPQPPRPRALMAVLAWALTVAFVVSAISSLWCYYTFAAPLGPNATGMENHQGTVQFPRNWLADNIVSHAAGRYPTQNYSSLSQIILGMTITAMLQIGVLRFASWPFIPVAYMVSNVWFIRLAWWSIFLGWLCKVIILRFGGAKLYQQLKPVFVGLVVGEALAAGFWLLVALVLVWLNQPYQVLNFSPS